MSEPRRHHFLPRSYLAGFTETGRPNGRLCVVNVGDGRQWVGTPATVGHQRDLYRVDSVAGLEPNSIESALSEIESAGAAVIRRISDTRRLPDKDGRDYAVLMNYMALMEGRGPDFRDRVLQFVEEIAKKTAVLGSRLSPQEFRAEVERARAAGADIPEDADLEGMHRLLPGRDFDIRASNDWFLQALFTTMDTLTRLLAARQWRLFDSQDSEFLTSGRPVSLQLSEPKGVHGFYDIPAFGRSDTDVTFALTRKLSLLGRFEETASEIAAIPISRNEVAKFNNRTIDVAERFICWSCSARDVPYVASSGAILHASTLARSSDT